MDKSTSRWKPATYLIDLSYADGISLVSKEFELTQAMLTNIEKEVAKIGLHINSKKTEIILINHNTLVKIELWTAIQR